MTDDYAERAAREQEIFYRRLHARVDTYCHNPGWCADKLHQMLDAAAEYHGEFLADRINQIAGTTSEHDRARLPIRYDHLLAAVEVLAHLVREEWSMPLAEVVGIHSSGTAEQADAVAQVDRVYTEAKWQAGRAARLKARDA